MGIQRQTITIAETAKILGLSRSATFEAARRNQLPAIKIGRRWLVIWPRLREQLGLTDSDIPGGSC